MSTWQAPCQTSQRVETWTSHVPVHWYAVHTRARHERAIKHKLEAQGVETLLPAFREVHRWSDRRKTIELPVFACYLFVHAALTNHEQAKIAYTDGILRIVGSGATPTAIPDEQIETIQRLVAGGAEISSYPFMKVGQRVRIRGGALEGIEGIILSQKDQTLIVSIDAIQRSLAVRLSGYDLEPA